MIDDKPPEKPTLEFEKPPAWAVAMSERMAQGFQKMDANISLVANDLGLVKDELRVHKEASDQRFKTLEDRANSTSIRAKTMSEQDLAQDAQLAQERAAREALAAKVDAVAAEMKEQTAMLTSLANKAGALLADPRVKAAGMVLWMAFTGWLASKGLVAK